MGLTNIANTPALADKFDYPPLPDSLILAPRICNKPAYFRVRAKIIARFFLLVWARENFRARQCGGILRAVDTTLHGSALK